MRVLQGQEGEGDRVQQGSFKEAHEREGICHDMEKLVKTCVCDPESPV